MEIEPETPGPAGYFPERSLARFLASKDMATRIFAFEKRGVVPLREAYATLQEQLGVDTVVLGVKNREELRECLNAEADGPLDADQLAAVESACATTL